MMNRLGVTIILFPPFNHAGRTTRDDGLALAAIHTQSFEPLLKSPLLLLVHGCMM